MWEARECPAGGDRHERVVSAAIQPSGPSARIVAAALEGRFTVLVCDALLDELLEVLTRGRIERRHGRPPEATAAFVADLRALAEVIPVTDARRLCRDPKDDVVVATALNGSAQVLVSGDQAFAGTEEVRSALGESGAIICTPRAFLAILAAEESYE